ncbi:MAG: hypothetical protein DSY90_06355 [Deltaproteobacteria bacterium]|nr:MAG: hypothetical protein DSY90_06355 [Deltaproteobacteria bacterium]
MRAFYNGRGIFLCLVMGLLYSVVLLTGCATTNTGKAGASDTAQMSQAKKIVHVEMRETDLETHILVTGDQHLTFTAIKQPNPPVVIFYFPETAAAAQANKSIDLKSSTFVTGINLTELTETGHTVRLEIKTAADAPYTVSRQGNALDITFQKLAMDAAGEVIDKKDDNLQISTIKEKTGIPADAVGQSAGRVLNKIEAKAFSDHTRVMVRSDGMINKYKSFTLDQPPRIVIDLFNIKSSADKEQKIAVGTRWVKKIRYYSDSKKLRVVLETDKKYLNSFSVVPSQNGLIVNVGSLNSVQPAAVQAIKYQDQAGGASQIVIQTSRHIQYRIQRMSPRWLRLFLLNSRLPDGDINLDGALSQKGAIASITPGHSGNSAYVDVRLKTAVPYLINQEGTRLKIQFESPPANSISVATAAKNSSELATKKVESKIVERKPVQSFDPILKEPVYKGEKIALDFYNTDIRNVFRILADVSGENFAVDKDVEGKVTLSLNKPVPWDRILDLVLKMNQLEKEKQQGITRIATLATLQAEKKARMAAREAAVKEQEARVKYLEARRRIERLQPLETAYIQVNYADADEDVKPQVEPLLSSYTENGKLVKRGSVSIDKRNNVVIITDVPEVIARARDTVLKIDKLVPQVLIEARIVEASTDFSREIGLSWGMTTGIQPNDPRAGIGPQRGFDLFGGTYGWDTAINHPFSSGTPMEIGFNIARIAAGPFGLNARLKALEVNGNGKIISSPKVLSRDNEEAVITQGREYPYFEESESGGTTVKFKKVELKLTVLPNITPDNRVAIKLKIEKKDVISFVGGVPVLSTREASSDFLMNNGDTLVIGGIHKITNRLSESGFPWLSKLPLLGWLFKTKNKELDKEELLIFITPKILRLEQRRPVVEKTSVPMG